MPLLPKLGLLSRTSIAILLVLLLSFALTVTFSYRQLRQFALEEAVEKSRLISRQAVQVREYLSKHLRLGEVALSDQRYALIPVVASNRVSQDIGRDLGYTVRQTSQRYRNPDNAPDPYERTALQAFEANPYLKEWHEVVGQNGRLVFRYLQPFRADESCLVCHGLPEESPEFIRARFPVEQDQAYGYRIGEIIGAVSIQLPMDRLQRQMTLELRGKLLYFSAVFIGLAILVGLLLRLGVIRPLHQLSAAIDEVVRTGHFQRRLEPRTTDEVGRLMANFNRMAEQVGESTRLLEASERRFRALTDSARDGIVGFLADGRIILCNHRAAAMLGFSETEAMGMDVAHLVDPACTELHQLGTAAYLEREAERLLLGPQRCRLRGRDGGLLDVELTLVRVETEDQHFYTAILHPLEPAAPAG